MQIVTGSKRYAGLCINPCGFAVDTICGKRFPSESRRFQQAGSDDFHMTESGNVVLFNSIQSFPLFHRKRLTLLLNRKQGNMRTSIGWRATKPEETEAALNTIAALPHGARLDGRYLAGGYWRATWAETFGEARGTLILTASWEQYSETVHRALTILNSARRKPAAAETSPANLRNSATA